MPVLYLELFEEFLLEQTPTELASHGSPTPADDGRHKRSQSVEAFTTNFLALTAK